MHDLSENVKFFDRLVDLVPAKYYHPSDQEVLNTKFLKKNAKAAAKQVMKEQYKQNKRAKLNPDTAKTSLQIQQQQVEGLRQSDPGEVDDAAEPAESQPVQEHPVKKLNLPAGGTPSHTTLQEKLQQRLQELREQRHADEDKSKPNKGKRKKDKDQDKHKQIKQNVPKQSGTAAAAKAWRHSQLAPDKGIKRKADESGQAGGKKQKISSKSGLDEQADVQFGRVEVGQGHGPSTKRQKKKKPSKEQLLQEAVQKQQHKADDVEDPKGPGKQEAWKSALARARGEKVLDDPKLLRKSLKKDAKLKEKKSKAWKQRQGEQKQAQAKKQKKRQDNLQGRADTKKAHKVEKREKKLMRAGFEGRRATFINA
ncbi:hypothetical protein ABBQ38_011491 [Trebouxia sp. C0009 RCD-2024]